MRGELTDLIGVAGAGGVTFDDVAVAAAEHRLAPAELLAWWTAQRAAGLLQPDAVPRGALRFRLAS
jgi:hypothetical protein